MEFKIFEDANEDIKKLRYDAFVVEKNIPEEIEFDGKDAFYKHFCLYDGQRLVASLRGTFEEDSFHIGRVAVPEDLRKKGYGKILINNLVSYLENTDCRKIILSAIDSAVGFYEKLGFETKGDYFCEAGYPHINMEKTL